MLAIAGLGTVELIVVLGGLLSLIGLLVSVCRRPEISCLKCDALAKRGGRPVWQVIVSVLFFPIGLLSLLAGRKPTVCQKCGHRWIV